MSIDMKQWLAPPAAFILRNIPSHRYRKRFARKVGPYLQGAAAMTAYGFPMIVRWHDNANRIGFEGSYGVVEDFIKSLPGHALFIDIGANQGCTSILAEKTLKMRGGGMVMAYEPSPATFNLLQENIALNECSCIHSFRQAVSSRRGELYLDAGKQGNSGAAFVSAAGERILAGPIVLDDIERFGHFKEIHVKIDTEGYELEVLRGIQELLVAGRVKKLVVEVNDMHLQRFGADSASLYEFLEQFGYLPSMGLQSGHYDEVFFRS